MSGEDFTNTPNLLTVSRIAAVPLVVLLLFIEGTNWNIAAALLFGLAAITDIFDGYIARSQKLETVYGKLMDPLADKFLVVSSLIMLQYLGRIHPILVMLLICREFAVTGLRALASAEGIIIQASLTAKLKTVTQMIAIPFLMVKENVFGFPWYTTGHILLWLSLGISFWSASDYIIEFFRSVSELRGRKKKKKKLSPSTH